MTPPRAARWLVERRLPAGPEGDTIRGDLLEEFRARTAGGAARARWWYWRAALSIALRYRTAGVPSVPRCRQSWHDALRHDVRYAVRTLARARAFSALVVITLALGIGANTAIFSALNAVLLKPLPYAAPDRLVHLVAFNPAQGIAQSNVSAPDVLDWTREVRSFERIGAYYTFSTTLRGRTPDAPAERIGAAAVVDLLDVLGVTPVAGRSLARQDAHAGPATAAVVSHALWQRRFGGDGAVVGRPLRPGAPTAIVGVMPPGFSYPDTIDLWVPLAIDPAAEARNNRMYEAIARLRPGATVAAAQAELDAISARLDTAYPDSNRGWRVRAVPMTDYVVGDARRTLMLLLAAVGLVMLVACANVANLCLAQGLARRREIAIRSAIGAGRGRVFGQILTESLLLSAMAGVCGVAIGRWGLRLLIAIGGAGIPRLQGATLDRTVLLFALAVAAASGIVFGFLPALQLSRVDGTAALRDGGGRTGNRLGARRAIVVAEVAIALVLLAAAGLVGRSFSTLQRIDVGFEPRNLLTFRVSLNGPRYRQPGSDVAYFDELVRRLTAVPGVRSAGAALSLPIGGGGFYLGRGFIRPGRPHPTEGYVAGYQIVTPSYLHTLGATLLRGRGFTDRDVDAAGRVAIVNHAFAERFFAGEDPIGQQVFVWRDERTPREIVGVVADLKSGDVSQPAGADIFVPMAQAGSTDMTLVVRTADAPAPMAAAARQVVQALDPTQAAFNVKTFEAILRDALAQRKFGTALFAGFAGLALLLAAVGLYGVMTQLVNGRVHEMGVRLALGAPPSAVRRLIVRQAMALLALGIAAGLPIAVLSARLLGTLLYGVGPGDPVTLAAVVTVLAAATGIAAYLPARRATQVDAVSVLRT